MRWGGGREVTVDWLVCNQGVLVVPNPPGTALGPGISTTIENIREEQQSVIGARGSKGFGGILQGMYASDDNYLFIMGPQAPPPPIRYPPASSTMPPEEAALGDRTGLELHFSVFVAYSPAAPARANNIYPGQSRSMVGDGRSCGKKTNRCHGTGDSRAQHCKTCFPNARRNSASTMRHWFAQSMRWCPGAARATTPCSLRRTASTAPGSRLRPTPCNGPALSPPRGLPRCRRRRRPSMVS